ncbi:MAG: hypothetical protein QGH60_22340, partial [Phycisphaerae bacterium]|nr:hypothetical protein [Phycisphaerae bacterium]
KLASGMPTGSCKTPSQHDARKTSHTPSFLGRQTAVVNAGVRIYNVPSAKTAETNERKTGDHR